MLDEAGENKASWPGRSHVYSRATNLLLLNQIGLPASSFCSLHVRTKRVLKHIASAGRVS